MNRIMVAESDTDRCADVQRELTRVGYDVHAVHSYEAAIDALSSTRPVDVLLSALDGPDAVQLLHVGQQVSPATRSVLVTNGEQVATPLDGSSSAVRVLYRPFDYDDLHDAIETAFECSVGFHGMLHGLSLLDLLQMFHVSGRSVRVHIEGPVRGVLFLRHGELVHARSDDLVGVDALARLITEAERGWIRTASLGYGFEDTINAHFDGLLLDVLRRSDESRRDAAMWSVPPMDFPVDAVVRASSRPPPLTMQSGALAPPRLPSEFGGPETAPPPSDLDAVLHEHIRSWLARCRKSGTITTTMQVVAVALQSEDGASLQGDLDPDEVAEAAIEVRDVIGRITGDPSGAVVEIVAERTGVALCWDDQQRALLVLADEVQKGSVTTWFRWRLSGIGRAFAPRLYPHDG